MEATHTAYGNSQARGGIGATAASLHHRHSNLGPKPCLQPAPQVTAMPDPQPTEGARDQTRIPSNKLVGFVTAEPQREILWMYVYTDAHVSFQNL